MLFHADLMRIRGNDSLTIQIGIFDELSPVDVYNLTIRIGIFDEFIPEGMHEDMRNTFISRMPHGI